MKKNFSLLLILIIFFVCCFNLEASSQSRRKYFQSERVTQLSLRAVEIADAKFDTPLDVPIDFLRTNMVDSFKVRFTSADEQKIITARKSGISPLLKVSVQNNGPKLVILLNFQTSNLSALNLKPYQVTTENGAEVHKFQIKGVAEKYFVPGAITLFVFVPRAATRTGKFTLTPSLEDLSASSSSSTSGGVSGISSSGGINCRMFQGTLMCEPDSSSGEDVKLDTYVIIDGPNAGTVIFADGVSVSSKNNPDTNANGFITEAMPVTPDAGCESQHYHGTLFGVGDTGMCGHGKIRQVKILFNQITDLSELIKVEKDAIEKIKEPNYPAALENLNRINLGAFEGVLDTPYTMGDIKVTDGQFMILQTNLVCIAKKESEAKILLANLRDNKAKLFDEVKASKLIEDAIKCKLRFLDTFLKIEKKSK